MGKDERLPGVRAPLPPPDAQAPLSCNLDEDPELKLPPMSSRAPTPAHSIEPLPERQEDKGQRSQAAVAEVSLRGLGRRKRASVLASACPWLRAELVLPG